MKLPSVFIALGFCSMSSAGWAFDASSALVIQDVTVVSTLDGSLTPHQNVMLQSGRIVSVDGAKVRLSRSAHAIKGSGKYLIPGFSDMHVHAIETADLKPSFFPLLVANGITRRG
jgi:adenine deaminase